MKPQLIIFDWAGTTVDYGCFAPVNAFALAFQKFGVNPTVEEIRAPMGMLKRDHIRTMLAMPAIQRQWQENQGAADEAAVEKLYGVFEDSLMESLADYAAPKPGVVETVEALRAQGIRIGSTTGYTDQMMAVVTQGAARQGYAPDAWFSPDSVQGLGRPYPYMIYANMAQFQIPSVADVVKVGDTVADIQEGKNAGILSLGVLEGAWPGPGQGDLPGRRGRRRFVKPVPAAPVAGGTGEGVTPAGPAALPKGRAAFVKWGRILLGSTATILMRFCQTVAQ